MDIDAKAKNIADILFFLNFGNHGTVGELSRNSYFSVLGHPSNSRSICFRNKIVCTEELFFSNNISFHQSVCDTKVTKGSF